jgi:indole-3-glycerol phosphate synthase / phosphoribosylanthranilate isomerase
MSDQTQNVKRKTQNFLEEIVAKKRRDLKSLRIRKKKTIFHNSLFIIPGEKVSIIAEVKFASPTSPDLGSSKDLLSRVKQYEKAGADAISFITEKHYFKGDKKFIPQIKKTVKLPVLQKDFVIDQSQIYEAAEIGSDALLLIARLVDTKTLKQFVNLCFKLTIEPVVEINSEEDLKKAVATKTRIIAVNARDLETFAVDIEKACELMKKIPDKYMKLGFSGIQTREEVSLYINAGAKGVLVGTSLMKAENIQQHISSLRGVQRRSNLKNKQEIATHTKGVRNDDKVKVKICGIRSLEAAQAAINAGADYIGFNFVRTSKRYIDPMHAQHIAKQINGKIKIVGVFQNEKIAIVKKIADKVGLHLVQLHGVEDEAYMYQLTKPIIKSTTVHNVNKAFFSDFVLLDRVIRGKGNLVDFDSAAKLADQFKTFFAGGLTPENVAAVIKKVKPFAVDVASGVETNGKQDLQKIRKFIKNAKGGID